MNNAIIIDVRDIVYNSEEKLPNYEYRKNLLENLIEEYNERIDKLQNKNNETKIEKISLNNMPPAFTYNNAIFISNLKVLLLMYRLSGYCEVEDEDGLMEEVLVHEKVHVSQWYRDNNMLEHLLDKNYSLECEAEAYAHQIVFNTNKNGKNIEYIHDYLRTIYPEISDEELKDKTLESTIRGVATTLDASPLYRFNGVDKIYDKIKYHVDKIVVR